MVAHSRKFGWVAEIQVDRLAMVAKAKREIPLRAIRAAAHAEKHSIALTSSMANAHVRRRRVCKSRLQEVVQQRQYVLGGHSTLPISRPRLRPQILKPYRAASLNDHPIPDTPAQATAAAADLQGHLDI
jgi:hypothetical protein